VKSLKSIEMIKAGYTNDGRFISVARIKDLVENTIRAMEDGFKPKVKVGDSHENALMRGYIEKLELSGNSAIGDVAVADEVYDKLANGEIPEDRSVEIGKDFVLSDGQCLGEVIMGIVFGIAEPAEHSLESIFGNFDGVLVEGFERLQISNGAQSAEALLSRVEVLENTLSKEREELSRLKEDYKRQIEDFIRKTKNDFLERLIVDGKIIPAQRKSVSKIYDTLFEKYGREETEKRLCETFQSGISIHTSPQIKVGDKNVPEDSANGIDPTFHDENSDFSIA